MKYTIKPSATPIARGIQLYLGTQPPKKKTGEKVDAESRRQLHRAQNIARLTDLENSVKNEIDAGLCQYQHQIMYWRQNVLAVPIDDRYISSGEVGSADFFIIAKLIGGKFVGVECKRRDGGRQSDDQKIFQTNVEANNGLYFLSRSWAEAKAQLLAAKVIRDA